MEQLLAALKPRYPKLHFAAGESFRWSANHNTVYYAAEDTSPEARWGLLHETGHGLLAHDGYEHDFGLLELEMAAWREATKLADGFGVIIPDDYIQDCLDTYRSWLYRRSICPSCEAVGLQYDDAQTYGCFNCGRTWRVSNSQFCRPYRSRTL